MKLRFISKVWFTCASVTILSETMKYEVVAIEEYFIITCDFIGRRFVSPASYIFLKTKFCQSNCPRYVWCVTEESTVVADDGLTPTTVRSLVVQADIILHKYGLHFSHNMSN